MSTMRNVLRSLAQHPLVAVGVILVGGLAVATVGAVLKNRAVTEQMRFGNRATMVVTTSPHMAAIVDQIEAVGTTSANESVNLAPRITDTVSRVLFDDGQHVKGGTILVELTEA